MLVQTLNQLEHQSSILNSEGKEVLTDSTDRRPKVSQHRRLVVTQLALHRQLRLHENLPTQSAHRHDEDGGKDEDGREEDDSDYSDQHEQSNFDQKRSGSRYTIIHCDQRQSGILYFGTNMLLRVCSHVLISCVHRAMMREVGVLSSHLETTGQRLK